jgi:hypothetical protein
MNSYVLLPVTMNNGFETAIVRATGLAPSQIRTLYNALIQQAMAQTPKVIVE